MGAIWTWNTSRTWWTHWTAFSTVWTWGTWLAWLTLSAWLTWLTWNAWWTHQTHWTFLLFTFTSASSLSAFTSLDFSFAFVVHFGNAFLVSGGFICTGADSVSSSDVLFQKVEIWAARQTGFLFFTFRCDSDDHHIGTDLSELEGCVFDLLNRVLFDNTGVGHDHNNFLGVFGSVLDCLWVGKHSVSFVETLGDVVTMAHVCGSPDGLFKRCDFIY